MQRRDQIDPTRAKHFAWMFVRPGDSAGIADLLRAVEAEREARPGRAAPAAARCRPPRRSSSARARRRARRVARCRSAWPRRGRSADDDASARATKRLLARADRLGVALAGMGAHPAEAVRLLRLVVRHASRMTRRQRERAAYVARRRCRSSTRRPPTSSSRSRARRIERRPARSSRTTRLGRRRGRRRRAGGSPRRRDRRRARPTTRGSSRSICSPASSGAPPRCCVLRRALRQPGLRGAVPRAPRARDGGALRGRRRGSRARSCATSSRTRRPTCWRRRRIERTSARKRTSE